MSKNPYKDYYDAVSRGDEWAGLDAYNARKRIEKFKEIASFNGMSEEAVVKHLSRTEMGG